MSNGLNRDRLLVFGAGMPAILGYPIGLLVTHDFIDALYVGVPLLVVAMALSLTPPVIEAKRRLLSRKIN